MSKKDFWELGPLEFLKRMDLHDNFVKAFQQENNFERLQEAVENWKKSGFDFMELISDSIASAGRSLSLACDQENNIKLLNYLFAEYQGAGGNVAELIKDGFRSGYLMVSVFGAQNNFELTKFLFQEYEENGGNITDLISLRSEGIILEYDSNNIKSILNLNLNGSTLLMDCTIKKINSNLISIAGYKTDDVGHKASTAFTVGPDDINVIKCLLSKGADASELFTRRHELAQSYIEGIIADDTGFDWQNYQTPSGLSFLDLAVLSGTGKSITKFSELPLNLEVLKNLQLVESSLLGQPPYFLLKQQKDNMSSDCKFYEQNPQYKIPGSIISAIQQGKHGIALNVVLACKQNIQEISETLPNSLKTIKDALSDLVISADSEVNSSNENSSASPVVTLGDTNGDDADFADDSYDNHG